MLLRPSMRRSRARACQFRPCGNFFINETKSKRAETVPSTVGTSKGWFYGFHVSVAAGLSKSASACAQVCRHHRNVFNLQTAGR